MSYPDPDGPYARVLRGRFLHHPEGLRVVRLAGVPDPFGLAPAEPFDIRDEHYFVKCGTAATRVFLRSVSGEGESAAGWTYPGTKDTLGRILRWLLA